ncbi:MAG: alpha/beta hydrolase family protein [Mycobacteriales bacterium]
MNTPRSRHGLVAFATAGAVLTALLATVPPAEAKTAGRGGLLSATPVAHLTPAGVADQLGTIGLDPPAATPHGADEYRLVYRTVGVDGRPTTASGLVIVPRRHAKVLRVVVHQHGTTVGKNDAPSISLDGFNAELPLYYAAAGYLTVTPDYLGLGVSPGQPPFLHAGSEATASVDMLRATRTFAGRQHLRLDNRLLLTGFSQGAHAAMALGKALAGGADRHWRVAALAPVSGPYDLADVELPAVVAGRTDPLDSAVYLGYLTVSWNPIYHLYGDPAEVFRDPATAALFDATHSEDEVFGTAPPSPEAMFTPAYLARLAHPDGGLLRAIREVDTTCDWKPRVPVHLIAARGDRDVVYGNAEQCLADLRARGARGDLSDVGDLTHFPGALAATPHVLALFQHTR